MRSWFKWRRDAEASANEPASPEPRVFVPEPPQGAYLEAVDKEGRKWFLPLTDAASWVLGTAPDCTVPLDDRFEGLDQVAPRHAQLERWQSRWVLVPLGRDAPIFVNGRRAGETVLRDGVEIRLGFSGPQFRFHSDIGGSGRCA